MTPQLPNQLHPLLSLPLIPPGLSNLLQQQLEAFLEFHCASQEVYSRLIVTDNFMGGNSLAARRGVFLSIGRSRGEPGKTWPCKRCGVAGKLSRARLPSGTRYLLWEWCQVFPSPCASVLQSTGPCHSCQRENPHQRQQQELDIPSVSQLSRGVRLDKLLIRGFNARTLFNWHTLGKLMWELYGKHKREEEKPGRSLCTSPFLRGGAWG